MKYFNDLVSLSLYTHLSSKSISSSSDPITGVAGAEILSNHQSETLTEPPSVSVTVEVDSHTSTSNTNMKSTSNKAKVSKGFEAINTLLMSVVGQQRATLETKKNPITDDYQISSNVLGLGTSNHL